MRLLNVAAAALNQTPLDWPGNRRRIADALGQARAAGAQLVCLPELCISGYGCEDAFHSPGLWRMAWQVLQELLPETGGLVVALGMPLPHQNGLYDTAFLAGDGIHYEPRWFKPWPLGASARVDVEGQEYPLGDWIFDCGGVRIGFEICEDAWVANRPGARLALAGVDVILNPSASHFAFGKFEVRKRFVLEGSRAFGCSYVYANLLGNEAGRAIYDGGCLIASAGRLAAAGPRFSFADVQVTTAVVDLDLTRLAQSRTISFEHDVATAVPTVEMPFAWTAAEPARVQPASAAWETGPYVKEEEFARAIALALLDYLRKSRSRGFVVSLSGGADSSAVSCLVSLAVDLAAAELGREGFCDKLGYLPELREATDVRAMVGRLLTCVYQSTRHSGEVTRTAARELAAALGAQYLEFDVDALVDRYIEIVERALERRLTWERDDLALQNIQARVRSPGIWLLANATGALLLSTSNRSEAAVGYATMDGDTSGGVSPIAGIDKAFLLRWLRWMEQSGPDGTRAVPALRLVTAQAPTAELRPAASGQTDERDLMP
jgi:NAD+ synthase (glutamine-hydrolysing)